MTERPLCTRQITLNGRKGDGDQWRPKCVLPKDHEGKHAFHVYASDFDADPEEP